jgi:hypothetical protein
MLRWISVVLLVLCIALNLLNRGTHHHSEPRWFWHLWWQTHLIWQWAVLPLLVLVVGSFQPLVRAEPKDAD